MRFALFPFVLMQVEIIITWLVIQKRQGLIILNALFPSEYLGSKR